MPTIANPRGGHSYEGPSDDSRRHGTPAGLAPSLVVRIRTAAQRCDLTRSLAQGADPSARPELALRAAQLTSRRSRKVLARTLRRTVVEAREPMMTRSRVVIIRRGAVLEAENAITVLIWILISPAPVRAEGMAIAERIITNGMLPAVQPSRARSAASGHPCRYRGPRARSGAVARVSDHRLAPTDPSRGLAPDPVLTWRSVPPQSVGEPLADPRRNDER